MKRRLHFVTVCPSLCGLAVSLAILIALPGAASAQTTALVGARVIDGRGKVIDSATIVVRDGKIVAVGPAARTTVPEGAQRVDVAGATIVPGFVNAHGHLAAVVGMRNVPDGYTRDNLVRQLKTYAMYGVTTVFSLGDDQEIAFQLRNEQSAGAIDRARLFVA